MAVYLNLYTILQLLSLTLFENISLLQLLKKNSYKNESGYHSIYLKLFDS